MNVWDTCKNKIMSYLFSSPLFKSNYGSYPWVSAEYRRELNVWILPPLHWWATYRLWAIHVETWPCRGQIGKHGLGLVPCSLRVILELKLSWGSRGTDPNSWAENCRSDVVWEPFFMARSSPCGLTGTVPAGGKGGKTHMVNPPFRSALHWVASFAVPLASVPVLRPFLCLYGTVRYWVTEQIACFSLSDEKQLAYLMG